MSKTTNDILAAAIVATSLATGCAPSVAGAWEHEDADSSYGDVLELDDAGEGENVVDISIDFGEFTAFVDMTFDVEWKDEGDDEYTLELSCADGEVSALGDAIYGCDAVWGFYYEVFDISIALDYELDCALEKDGEELECEVDGDKFAYERIE